jgi:soluble lytic murein transglycosylase-like protein
LSKSLPIRYCFTALAVLAAVAPAAQAFERVTLRNGFELRCDHHVQVEGRTRLFLSSGEDSYIEFTPAEIAAVEQFPDPIAAAQSTPATVPKSGPEPRPAATSEVRLSPADLHEMLTRAGSEHHLDVDLLGSLVKAESGGNASAVSRAGAQGLMQLMPLTASSLGVQDSFKPEENLRGGSAYLDAMLTRYHENLALALAAYNAGPAAVDKYRGVPPYRETQAYVARVIHEFNLRVLAARLAAARASQAVAPAPQDRASR